MKSVILLLLLLLSLSHTASGCPMEGYWKSNEALTLKSLHLAEGITDKQLEVFSNNFFGKFFIHIGCREFTAVMEDWIETTEYELMSFDGEKSVIKYYSELEGEVTKESKLQGECYSIPINGGQFEEYFCPIKESEYNNAFREALLLKKTNETEKSPCTNT